MITITADNLRAHIGAREADLGRTMPCGLRQMSAAYLLANHLVGNDWVQRNLTIDSPSSFLTKGIPGSLDRLYFEHRLVALGEILFNLQQVEGFTGRAASLRTSTLETAIGELEGACVLLRSGIPFRFVQPSGIAGSDFDVEAIVGATTVACEMKSKLESTTSTAESVKNTLDRAREQLPQTSPGLVFLRLPYTWLTNDQFRDAIVPGIEAALRSSRRISGVVAHWEEWRPLKPEGAFSVTRFHLWKNPAPRIDLEALDRSLRTNPESFQHWIRFDDLLCDAGDRVMSASMLLAMQVADYVDGKGPPPPNFGTLYRGDLEALKRAAPDEVNTVFDFTCDHFELLDALPTAKSAIVSIPNDPIREFRVLRALESSQYQFQLLGRHYDAELNLDEPSRHIRNRVDCGTLPDDSVIALLRRLFVHMRGEGDLVRPHHQLTNLRVIYTSLDLSSALFAAEYHYQSIVV
jgi:hypothetical protein